VESKGVALKQNNDLDFTELIERYLICKQAEGKSPKTTGWYNEMLRAFLCYLRENHLACRLSTFNINIIRDYILYLNKRPKIQRYPQPSEQTGLLSRKTLQCHVRVLKAFASWLHAEGYTTENRLQNLKLPKAPTTIIEPLNSGKIRKIIACMDKRSYYGARNHAIFITMLDTGLRASEITDIDLSNLNLTDGFIKVMGKGAKERIVPVGKHVRMILFSYVDKIRPDPVDPDHNRLFLSSTGRPVTVNAIKLMFSRLAKASGVTRLHAHLCRHTFATNYLLNGGDILSLKEILGHTSFEMVNHYLHFTSSQITVQHQKYSPIDKLQSEIEFID
jgi:site-specific recombinase XerD